MINVALNKDYLSEELGNKVAGIKQKLEDLSEKIN